MEIIVVSGKRNRLLTFSLHFWIMLVSALVVATIVIAFIYNLLNLTVNDVDRSRLKQLNQENDLVRRELKKIETEVQTMTVTIDSLESYDTRIRTYGRLEPVGQSIQRVETDGGPDSAGDFRDLRLLSPLLDNLLIRAERQSAGYRALLERVGDKDQQRDHTPSIVPVQGWFVNGFGYRLDPFTGTIKMHEGIDLAGPLGSPIVAPAAGTVRSVAEKPGFGLTIEINHGYEYTTFYAHCQRANVTEGSVVRRGDIIAFLGDTGKSTGPHLHYEVRVSGIPVNPVDYILTSGSTAGH